MKWSREREHFWEQPSVVTSRWSIGKTQNEADIGTPW
jgi:hypothetical protein